MSLKFLDCFAGIGGFRLGLERAGHTCVGHIEIDKFANISYNAIHNIKEGEYFGEDITTINPTELPDFDILCGGFPCQSFSIAGKQKGFEDTRGTLVFELLRIAKEKQPSYLFFENVPNILRHDNGKTFGTILRAMDELGYDAEWSVLNGKDGWGGNLSHKAEKECSLLDILEEDVPIKCFLSEEKIKNFIQNQIKSK